MWEHQIPLQCPNNQGRFGWSAWGQRKMFYEKHHSSTSLVTDHKIIWMIIVHVIRRRNEKEEKERDTDTM